jgi:hypothetical protein
VVLSSTQSPRCSGDHFPGDTRSSLGSTHFVSDRLLLGLVCSANMPFAKFSAVQQRIREDGGQVAPEVVGSTARPAEELAVRHQYVIAHSRVLGMPRQILASTRAQEVTSTSLEGEGNGENRRTGARPAKSPPEVVWGIRRASSWKEKQCTLPEMQVTGMHPAS